MNPASKVTAEHLKRAAYLYVRQSTLRQVFENTESTPRQYALQRRAVTLGWPEDRIVVIDHDPGQSGASTVEREGFQRLVADVGLALKFPKRGQAGVGEVFWPDLTEGTALDTLHNPRYAGAFCFGRTRPWKDAEGKIRIRHLPRSQWRFLKTQAHPGYLSWEEFVTNEQRLLENHQAHGAGESKAGVAREGPALLQGLVICGQCGRVMTIRYHRRKSGLVADYLCQRQRVAKTEPMCQQIQGADLDAAVGRVLVESVSPLALEVVRNVQAEIQSRLQEAERLRQQQVQRAQYEADQARVRLMRVDPNNRLVADTWETQWNEKLRLLAEAKEECEKRRQLDAIHLTEEQKAKIRALASDFPKLWQDPKESAGWNKRTV